MLGDQKKTRPLVKALEKDDEKVAELLADLETAPRTGDAFLQKLTELHDAFQAHVRTERKALLPAVLDALNRAQQAEQDAASKDAAELEAAELKAAELKAAELKSAQAAAEAKAASIVASAPAHIAAEPDEPPRVPLPIPAPLAAIAVLQTLAPPLASPAPFVIDLPKPLSMPLSTPTYGVQAWANLMQEAAAGAMMGYRLMMAYSTNTGFAALQTRLMKEQIELMTKSGAKMMEAAQRFTKTAG